MTRPDPRDPSRRDMTVPAARSVRDARRHVNYTHPWLRIVRVRRVDPMTPARGYIVTVDDGPPDPDAAARR